MREARVETALVRGVKRAGGEVRKLKWLGRRHAPDRMVMLPGGILHFVELKAPGKKARAGQAREHERMRKLCQLVFVLATLTEVEYYLGCYC